MTFTRHGNDLALPGEIGGKRARAEKENSGKEREVSWVKKDKKDREEAKYQKDQKVCSKPRKSTISLHKHENHDSTV